MRHLVLFSSLLLLQFQLCVSKTIVVDKFGFGQFTTIQAAIDAAADGDTVLVADGTYVGTGNQNIQFKGKAIVVRSQHGPTNCIIDCQRIGTSIAFVFNSSKDSSCVLDGFTIRNAGIGIWAYANSSPTVRNNVIDSCNVGIWCNSLATPSIIGNTIQFNRNKSASSSTSFIEGCAISLEFSSARISQNTIRKNSGAHGGGISCSHSSPLIIGNTIESNDGGGNGGGILIENDSHPVIQNNIIADNSAIYGGGICSSDSTCSASIVNNTILSNRATWGGGIISDNSSLTVSNTIIASSEFLPDLGRKFFLYNYRIHFNYDDATGKATFVDYTFAIHNCGQAGNVKMKSTGTGLGIDTTFLMQSEERLSITINSRFDPYANFGGLIMDITLDGGDSITIQQKGPFHSDPTSDSLTLRVDSSYHMPASFEFMEFGTKSSISYSDIYGNKEGGYSTGNQMSTLKQLDLTKANGIISADPLCDPSTYQLKDNSPCIDAGNPDASFNERKPVGKGTARCDMGAYGGPSGILTGIVDGPKHEAIALRYELHDNYPNPFNPSTNISFSLPTRSFVSLKVFDLIGREVTTIVSEELSAGDHLRQWNAGGLPSGVYFYRLEVGSFVQTKKLVLLR